MRAKAVAAVVLGALLAGCGAPGGSGGGGGGSVLDVTWGWGWEATGTRAGPYADMTPVERERMLDYYRARVRAEDPAGRPLPLVEQARFESGAASNAPTGGKAEAGFVDTAGRPVRLEDFRGKKDLVLVFTRGFPGYLCPLCTSYTAQIAHRYPEIAAAGAEVLLVFPGAPDRVGEFVAAAREITELEGPGALPFPVLLDVKLENVKAFGIEGDLARPSTYVIDRRGTVVFAFVGDQPHERPDVDTILAELKRLEGK